MRAPSLYTYFPSKNAIYDAMYAEGASQLAAALAHRPNATDPVETLRSRVRLFVDFCTTDPIRYQLVFERPIPGFQPTRESFEITVKALSSTRADLDAAGVHGERALDLFRALFTGLVSLQIANEPGGQRWTRLQDEALEMLLARYANPARAGRRKPRPRRDGGNTHSGEGQS
jgi:AcrR family transcriptional regulator